MLEGWRITAGRVQLFAMESPNKRTPFLLALEIQLAPSGQMSLHPPKVYFWCTE